MGRAALVNCYLELVVGMAKPALSKAEVSKGQSRDLVSNWTCPSFSAGFFRLFCSVHFRCALDWNDKEIVKK